MSEKNGTGIPTNGDLFTATRVLNRLAREKVPVGLALRLQRLVAKARNAAQPVEEVRNDLVRQYGEENQIGPESPQWEEFRSEFEELMNAEAEGLEDAEPLTASDLEALESVAADDLDALFRAGLLEVGE